MFRGPSRAALLAASLLCMTTMPDGAIAQAPSGVFTTSHATPEVALKAAQAALASCRGRGYQVAVAVADRAGVAQVVLRDRFAGAHTPDTALGKAWTAVSFRTDTLELARLTRPDLPASGIRELPRVVAIGGGVLIEARGGYLGAIGVSGAPSGDADDQCARDGLKAIRDDLEL
jgi:uncharacterized protein GlcG (DUF336 family)